MKRIKKKLNFRLSVRILFTLTCFVCLSFYFATYFVTYGEFVSRFEPESNDIGLTGIKDNIVTIDSLKSDYYYYMGQNYTDSDGTLPTIINKEIYSDNNLVQVKITYDSTDINTQDKGYVSLIERQDTYIYYKVYPINDNNTTYTTSDDYILIELIDNPFTDRPEDKAFNGWVTDYVGATISYDDDYYTRYVKVPVTLTDNVPDTIDITMHASWVDATTSYVNSSNSWANAFGYLKSDGMVQIGGLLPVYEDVSNYYISGTITNANYPSGAVDNSGRVLNGRCNRGTCTYYIHPDSGEYVEGTTYYQLSTTMQVYTVQIIDYEEAPGLTSGYHTAGYYKAVTIYNGSPLSGYYDENGVFQTSGTCNVDGGCTYYELIQYYDSNGIENLANDGDTYYYLVTRDTNIIVMNENMSTTWSSSQNKPFTLTSVYNGTDYRSSVTWSIASSNWWGSLTGISVSCYNDTVIENIKISSGATSSTNDTLPGGNTGVAGTFYASWNNVKFGRGITQNGNYINFDAILGGNNSNTGSSSNVTKYRLTVESGYYNNISLTNGNTSSTTATYIEGQGVFGSDYDRATNYNDNLIISYDVVGSFGGVYYSSTVTSIGFDFTVKSGKFGDNKYDVYAGIYIGGRGNAYGKHYTSRRIKYEGGYTYTLIGGPITGENRGNYNDSYIYITGGNIDMVYGGAGRSATYGNRIIQMTGGTINYSVFGGSNGELGGNGDGTINGSSYLYIGGNAIIGDENLVTNGEVLSGAEAGSVFGIGNGNTSYETIGSLDNSNIIIADEAQINNNVYGGGNYAAVGISSTASTTSTTLKIIGGTIYGNVYGGGNNNGSGSSSKTSTVTIEMTDGTVIGSIYGGSNQKGTIYGDAIINILGGTVNGSVYGGGLGGYASSTNPGTFVSQNVNVTIGDISQVDTPVIKTNIYGGSSFGTVNSSENNDTLTGYTTTVTVNNGIIEGNVFGGGKGSDIYTPNVDGNVLVTINNGTINSVFGANDEAGMPSGEVKVVVNNGTINNVFGGGNQTSLTVSDVTINNGTITNVFGGSNQKGTVTTSNIVINDGTVSTMYGGNNIGGTTITSNITARGGAITTLYGGGKLATTDSTNLHLNGTAIIDVYGGGESADITTSTLVNLNSSQVTNIYGGSNEQGSVNETTINAKGGSVNTIYGGNNAGGTTTTSNLLVDGSSVSYVYGGGNEALITTSNVNIKGAASKILEVYGGGQKSSAETTNVVITNGVVGKVFGGSNQAGTVTTSNVLTLSEETSNASVTMDVSYIAKDSEAWQSTTYPTILDMTITLTNNTSETINDYDALFVVPNSSLFSNYTGTELQVSDGTYSFNEINRYSGINSLGPGSTYSFSIQVLTMMDKDNIQLSKSLVATSTSGTIYKDSSGLSIDYIYGGNNAGGLTSKANITVNAGKIGYVYGGGNEAVTDNPVVKIANATILNEVYGGGNQAAINNNTDVDISNATILGNVFGGGNAGEVLGTTDVYVSASAILKSIYAGGNGMTAIVYGDTLLNIDNGTVINNHVFGGGNAALTGSESNNNANSIVNIAGATIAGNVYGGANTSVVYGTTNVNIGIDVVTDKSLIPSDIIIDGTVFGGGEANASGSEIYDFSFISVTQGININIDANGYNNFLIKGSIFGSGNASSTTGYSYINIRNYGEFANYKSNISIQRADIVTIDNSVIELLGATDRTNEYSDVLFTLSRIKELKLKNNSTLFLQTGSNLLEKFTSAVDENGQEVLAQVTIDDATKTVVKNVDNRIYMLEGKNLNIATNENVTAYGEVLGMTFLGMYTHDRDGLVSTALYNPKYNYGDEVGSDLYYFTSGSYVLGMHKTNHNIEVDGFYSNFGSEEEENTIQVKYINPVPEDSNYYMWVIGEQVASYEVNLTASKYVTLGTSELPLLNHYSANSTFSVVGFNYDDLASNVTLVDEYDIPRIAETSDIADTTMSLVMKSGTNGWLTKGSTSFLTDTVNPISGTSDYIRENTSIVPSFVLYLYHSKNLASSGDMGTVTISLLITTPIDDLTNDVERVNIVVNLSRALYNTSDYEATITPGKQYEMFATSDVNITNTGSFSTYYSLYLPSDTNPYKEGYHRALVSNFVFPENTKITMIDLVSRDIPEYYYYVVSADDVNIATTEFNNYGEASYNFNKFVRMGSTDSDNKYDDSISNNLYYDSTLASSHEEFIFIVDFSEANIQEDVLNKSLLVELRDNDNRTIINVLGASQSSMFYNVYYGKDAIIDVVGALDKDYVYPGSSVNLEVTTNFLQNSIDGVPIFDTIYDDQKLGVKLTIYDSNGVQVTGASLLGVTFTYNNITYYPRVDGTTRINIAPKVANVSSKIKINTTSSLAPGNYQIVIESFGSPDGIYYGLISSDTATVDITVLNTLYGLSVDMNDKIMIIDKDTGYTLNDNSTISFKVNYDSNLNNPNIRVSLYRRDYDSVYSLSYNEVDLLDYVTDSYENIEGTNEYVLLEHPASNSDLFMHLKDNLITGTYRLVFSIYDGDTKIGDVYKYLIIK